MSVNDRQGSNPEQAQYVNYNTRFHPVWPAPSAQQVLDWIRENNIQATLFKTYDGGGSNGLIIECQHPGDLARFCIECLNEDGVRCWAEDEQERHHGFVMRAGEMDFAPMDGRPSAGEDDK